jgi:5-methyltetrahydrofolate--homocysteine methyltransferase
VLDASRAVGVARRCCPTPGAQASFAATAAEYEAIREKHARGQGASSALEAADARANAFKADWSTSPRRPSSPARTCSRTGTWRRPGRYIDWTPFFRAWELAGNYPAILEDARWSAKARASCSPMRRPCSTDRREKWLTAKGVVGLLAVPPRRRRRRDLPTRRTTPRPFLRQQIEKRAPRANMCLADFIEPDGDWIGGFAVTAGHGIERIWRASRPATTTIRTSC